MITLLWTKGSFHTLRLSQATVPGSRAQMGICNSHSHQSAPTEASHSHLHPIEASGHLCSTLYLCPWCSCDHLLRDGITRCAPSGCPAQNLPHAPGQCEDKGDIGVDFHQVVDAPSQLVAVGTSLPKQPLPKRPCNQGKRLEADADWLWVQGSNNLLVLSASPKLNGCLLLGGTREKDGVKRKQDCFGGLSHKFFLNKRTASWQKPQRHLFVT